MTKPITGKRFLLKSMSEDMSLFLIKLVYESDPELAGHGKKMKAWEAITLDFNKHIQDKSNVENYKDLQPENVKKHFENEIYAPYVATFHKTPDETGEDERGEDTKQPVDRASAKEAPVREFYDTLQHIYFERLDCKRVKEQDKLMTENRKKENVLISESVKERGMTRGALKSSNSSNDYSTEGRKRRHTASSQDLLQTALSEFTASTARKEQERNNTVNLSEKYISMQIELQKSALELQRQEIEIRRQESAANQQVMIALLKAMQNR